MTTGLRGQRRVRQPALAQAPGGVVELFRIKHLDAEMVEVIGSPRILEQDEFHRRPGQLFYGAFPL